MTWEMGWVATLVTGGASAIIAFATFWMALSSRIATSNHKAETAESLAATATTTAAAFSLKHDMLAREINEVRVTMASKIAALESVTNNTANALQQAEDRITNSVEGLGAKVDKLGETVIRALADRYVKSRPQQ